MKWDTERASEQCRRKALQVQYRHRRRNEVTTIHLLDEFHSSVSPRLPVSPHLSCPRLTAERGCCGSSCRAINPARRSASSDDRYSHSWHGRCCCCRCRCCFSPAEKCIPACLPPPPPRPAVLPWHQSSDAHVPPTERRPSADANSLHGCGATCWSSEVGSTKFTVVSRSSARQH